MLATEGVLNLDKPAGITSHDVVNQIRRLAGIRRVGHAGTLDPLATGVLLVCLGRATRLAEYLVGLSKGYEAIVRLGQSTDTYDADGRIVAERSLTHVTADLLSKNLDQFRGRIMQRPPMYSAVKKSGQPLYKLARKGVTVKRQLREITIESLEQLEWKPPDLRLRIVCSSGTYIRSLAHDLGESLGCGGHVRELQRVAIGHFHLNAAIPLSQLNRDNMADHVQNIDIAVAHLSRLDLSDAEVNRLRHGKQIEQLAAHPKATLVRAYDPSGLFIGVLAASQRSWQPRKIFHHIGGAS